MEVLGPVAVNMTGVGFLQVQPSEDEVTLDSVGPNPGRLLSRKGRRQDTDRHGGDGHGKTGRDWSGEFTSRGVPGGGGTTSS